MPSPTYFPQIGIAGVWTLVAPFEALLIQNTSYQCTAIQTLPSIVATGADPVALYYTPVSLIQANYQADLAAGASIITLTAEGGNVLNVPSTYFTSMPDVGGVPYHVVLLGVSLGAIPDYLDLTALKQKIASDVQDSIGVTAEIKTVLASKTQIISNADDTTTAIARRALQATVQTDYAQLLALQTQLASAQQKIQMLEAYIIANQPSPTPTPTPAPTPTPTPGP